MMRSQSNAAVCDYRPMAKGDTDRRRQALRDFMARHQLKPFPWANAAGIGESSIRNFLSGESGSLSIESYEKLADAANSSVDELIGRQRGHVDSADIAVPAAALPSEEKGPGTTTFDGEVYAAVVRFDLYASAGAGAVLPDVTEIRDRLLFKMDWLRSVTRATLDEIACLTVVGDSMETALQNGDVVLIDMTQNNPARDDIYVIRRDGLLLVKRLQKSFKTKTLTIISDNPKYGSEEGVDPNDVQVIGRVFWMGRKM